MQKQALRLGVAMAATLSVAGPALAQERVPAVEIYTTTESYDPIRYESAFMIADAWRELGLDVTITPLEFRTLLDRFYSEQDFDAVILGWSGRVDRLDPQFFLGTLDSRQGSPGANNPGGYDNPAYDALFDAQSREFDIEARRDIVHEMQDLYMPDVPVVVLFHRDEVVAYNNTTFENMNPMAGEGLYSEWVPMEARPLGDRATLRIGGPQEPDNLNPLASTSVWGWKWMRLYYDRLVRLSPEVEPVPWMATEVEAVDDVTIDVTLREGLTWHDGEALTAEDVAFTFDYYMASDYSYFNSYLDPIDTVEVTGDLSVRFTLREPSAPFATITLSQIPILPRHIWEGIENPETLTPDQIPTVGSGPFVHDRYDRGEFMALTTNRDHFHQDEIAVDGVEFLIYADAEGVFTALQTGQIDMTAWRMEPGQIPLAEGNGDLNVVSVPDFGYFHFTFNTRRAPFDDVAVRRALTMAMDRERMVNVLLDGRGEVGTTVVAPVNAFWHNPFVERFEFDLEAARAELEAAGYSWDSDGRLQR
ncbi:ABC transporter substrate-binding protein [Rhodobaculum claviforme]|uniref:ABC transporter substrate-binding protein n=1 Tax=Rhodobaculum claviforme TaxID=1549854 RepID=A0A934TPN2_9RHOB|nr:ABC transporter substrate-binding protein [Rhodobaculum claviforme]MBK5928878.1 ABC transporter substrate-binding protein [Rhodobaculum claviforme]